MILKNSIVLVLLSLAASARADNDERHLRASGDHYYHTHHPHPSYVGPIPQAANITLMQRSSQGVDTCVQTQRQAGSVVVTPLQLYFLTDATGSMTAVLDQVQTHAKELTAGILASHPQTKFAAGYYRDVPNDQPPFVGQANFGATGDASQVISAFNAWQAESGGDMPEGQFYAFHEIATNPKVASWDASAVHVLVWFGDAPAHDPICKFLIPGLNGDVTEVSVTQDLKSSKIMVIAISTTPGGLNASPAGQGYSRQCRSTGTAGQATRIAAATKGLSVDSTVSGIISTIVNSINQVVAPVVNPAMVTVKAAVSCSNELNIGFTPAAVTVNAGGQACMTARVSTDICHCKTDVHTCTVQYVDQNKANIGSPQVIRMTPQAPDLVAPLYTPVSLCLWSPDQNYYSYWNLLTTNPFFKLNTAVDSCGGPVQASFVSCRTSLAANAVDTNNCIYIRSSDTLKVRPDASGIPHGGLKYYVKVALTDKCGNSVTTTSTIWIPHDVWEVRNSQFGSRRNCQNSN